MSKQIIALLVLFFAMWSCQDGKANKLKEFEIFYEGNIDSLANRYLELNRYSGSILVVKDGSIIYNKSFGLADYENDISFSAKTAFKIGNISKLITSDLINRLIAEKTITRTDKISDYLTDIESDISIGDFLDPEADVDFNAAGKLIEKVTNNSYHENIEMYGAELELENTYYNLKNTNTAVGYLYHNSRGNGLELERSPVYDLEKAFSSKGLKSTCGDLLKILKSTSKQVSLYGYLDDDGFSYSIENDLENNMSIIVLSNRRHPVANEISNTIHSILEGKAYTFPLLRKPYDIDKTLLQDFTGNYRLNENVSFEVLSSNDSLFVLMGPNKIYLTPQSNNQFYMQEMDAAMRFLRDSTDTVEKIELLNGFIDSDQFAYPMK